MSLGRATYLKSKDGGENSMSRKGGRAPYRNGIGPSDLGPMAKARLPEPQSPSVQVATPGRMRLITGSDRFCSGWCIASAARSERSAATRGVLKGMSGEPKGLSGQPSRTTGSPHGREPHGDRALIVVSGRESRLQGEGGQVSEGKDSRRCEMHNNRSRDPSRGYWRAGCTETCPSGSGRGGRKRGLARQPRRPSTSSFKRACVLFGIGEYLYGDEPVEPAEPRRATPTPTSNGDGRGELRNVPRDRISFPDARAFYGWLKDHGHLGLAEEIAGREDYPARVVNWTPEQIDAVTREILERTRTAR